MSFSFGLGQFLVAVSSFYPQVSELLSVRRKQAVSWEASLQGGWQAKRRENRQAVRKAVRKARRHGRQAGK